ncbi:sensor domain-containing diguanylate cyclase [Burkholderia sp. Ax-1719]|uniref:sensor domain-containing diguanylate cyclase n=1 Tax=Burkholderia sp. Ax-1719 TaxID=2608334 RepID=UPI001422E43F|nr:sensor domain-containing diguanylate cyclase [Burkholderia sp. Ax-1719]NIE64206.1 diguanylate cyclase [Burkholderia sp. Ax-1719]
MTEPPLTSLQHVESSAIGVAIVRRDGRGELIATAANRHFFNPLPTQQTGLASFPAPLKTRVPPALWPGIHDTLQACFTSTATDATEHVGTAHTSTQSWRYSLTPVVNSNVSATPLEMLITTVAIAPPSPGGVAEQSTHASRYRAVVDSAYDAIVTIDQSHNITLFNRAAENLFGYSAAEIVGQRIETLLPETVRAHHSRNVRQFADSPLTELRQMSPPRMDASNSVFGRHRDGSIIPVEIAISKIDVDGHTEFTAVVRDITDRAQLMDSLKKQAVTDALTGLPNRREFLEFVDKMQRTQAALSVFILDIDHFKEINDNYGHHVGDEVLCVLANVGVSQTGEPSLFARWGGEEFVAALPGADAAQAHAIAERLRQRFERHDFEHDWRLKPIHFTVSIGVVTREAGEHDVEALMKRADRALYRAKKSGRNRVETG